MSVWRNVRLVAYGFLAGTAGVAILRSRDMKKAYTHITAAVKRGGSSIAKTFTTLKENCDDINADANAINEKRAKEDRAREIADAKDVLARAQAEEKAEQKSAEEAARADAAAKAAGASA